MYCTVLFNIYAHGMRFLRNHIKHTDTEIYITMASNYHYLNSCNLRKCLGSARTSLANCPYDECGGGVKRFAKKFRLDEERAWQLELYCGKCQKFWYACRVCNVNTSAYTNVKMLSRHNRLYHTTTGWMSQPEPPPAKKQRFHESSDKRIHRQLMKKVPGSVEAD